MAEQALMNSLNSIVLAGGMNEQSIADSLNVQAINEKIDYFTETLIPLLITYGLKVLGAILILLIGYAISRWLGRRVGSYVEKNARVDQTLGPLLVKGIRFLVMAIIVVIVLSMLGLEIASIIAVLGTIGLAIGLALQGTLSNIASGIMLLVLRPFKVGDTVRVGGTTGIVDEIDLFVTYMHTFDNVAIIMPNSAIWGVKIENLNQNTTRRAELEFGIDYSDDMDLAMEILKETLEKDKRVLDQPAPLIAVKSLADSAVILVVRAWTRTEDLWDFQFDYIKEIKERFDRAGITIPFPQQTMHVLPASNPFTPGDQAS